MSRRRRLTRAALALIVVSVLAAIAASSAGALAFIQGNPCNDTQPLFVCPEGQVGHSYSITFQALGGCGPALPYQYRVTNGALPPGLSLSSAGTISGSPTQSGTYDFWVELSDQDPPTQSWCTPKKAEREFQINVLTGVSINQQSANPGTLGVPYSEQLTATLLTSSPAAPGSPLATATWSVDSGALPPGIALSSSGLLSGTPTTEGTYTFVVRASLDPSRFDTETETLVVRQPVTVQAKAPVGSEVGLPYSAQLTAAGGTGTFTWALSGGTLPQGLALDTASGAISGTPREAGRFPFQVKVTDTENRFETVDAAIVVSPRLVVPKQRLRVGKAGKLYRARVLSTGGVKPKVWRITVGPLPRGLHLDRLTGVISGKPKKSGIYRITVRATDGLKVTSTRALRITILAAPKKRTK